MTFLSKKSRTFEFYFDPGVVSKTARKTKDTDNILKAGRVFSWIRSFKKLLIIAESSRILCMPCFVKMPSVKLLKNLATVGNQESSALSVKLGKTTRKTLEGKDPGRRKCYDSWTLICANFHVFKQKNRTFELFWSGFVSRRRTQKIIGFIAQKYLS